MPFGNRTAATYDVAYRVNLGVFRAETAEAQALYERGVKGMSTQALKLALAQDKLNVALAKTNGSSRATMRAELELRRVQGELAGQVHRTSSALQAEERSLGRLVRGAVAGSGVFRGLGRSLAFASSAFLGGTGFVYAVRASINAAQEHQVVEGQLAAALKASGIEYEKYRAHIQTALRQQELLTGFTEEKTIRAFTLLVRTTGSVAGGLRALTVAGNVARGANIDLESASTRLARAFNGQTRGLTTLGLELPKGVRGWQALEIAQNKYAGSTAAYAKTAQGVQDRFNSALHQTEITIGTALLPTVTRYLSKGAEWLDQQKNQERVQHDVEAAVRAGGAAIHGLGKALDRARTLAAPFVDALGGIENTAKLLIGLKLALVFRGWASGFGLIGPAAVRGFAATAASADATTTRVISDAARMEAALDAATRPRNILITATGGGAGIGGFTGGGAKPGVAGRINQYGRNPQPQVKAPGVPGTGGLAGLILSALALGQSGESSKATVAWEEKTDTFYAVALNGSFRHKISESQARSLDAKFVQQVNAYKAQKARGIAGAPVAGTARPPISTYKTPLARPDRQSQIDLQLARTAGTTGPARVKALQDQRAFDDKYIRIQEGLLKTDPAHYKQHAATLQRLYAERQAAISEIAQIQADAARKEKNAAAKERSAYREGIRATEQRLKNAVENAKTPAGRGRAEDALVAFYRKEARDTHFSVKERERFTGLAIKERKDEAKREKTAADKAIKDRRDLTEQRLKNAVSRAEVAVTEATKGTAAYDKALAAEKKALDAEIKFYAGLEKIDKGRAQAQDTAKKLAAEKAKAQLGKGDKPGKTFAQEAFGFLQTLHGFDSQYGSNVFPAGSKTVGGHTVIVNQHFPSPTPDRFREAIFARHALEQTFQTA